MARMRKRFSSVWCPLCEGMHEVDRRNCLYRAYGVWNGLITLLWCPVREQSIYKLYGEDYRYVGWQQNTRSDIPDYEDIPF